MRSISKVGVLGAGVMGAQIAAHLANVGIPTLLLDIVPSQLTPAEQASGLTLQDRAVRNRLADAGVANLRKLKPAPLYDEADARFIHTGNFEDDWARLAECDWIIEVVVERLDVKRQVLSRLEGVRKPDAIVSSNTSGVSIEAMSADLSDEFRKNFLGTHFFNPPRYMKLLELIPTAYTDDRVTQFLQEFGETVLGKGVVVAKDTPNFIANRIGTFGLLVAYEEMRAAGLGVDEVDAITGPVLGRPRSATFRTLDVVGIDTFVHVANNVRDVSSDPEERAIFTVPEAIRKMVENGWIGEKAGQGFFKREQTAQGREILALDLDTLTYRPRRRLQSPAFEAARLARTEAERLRALMAGSDPASTFVWRTTARTLLYSASLVGVIADDIAAIDAAMRYGFNWERGPFELWDLLGVRETCARMEASGWTLPDNARQLLAGGDSWYRDEADGSRSMFERASYRACPSDPEKIDVQVLRRTRPIIATNPGGSLIDLGDDVLMLEFHSPKQAIGADFMTMMRRAADETEANYRALVIGGDGPNFCVGANLMLMLMEAQDDNFDELELVVRQFQDANMRIKYMRRPVVAAPYGLTLGGGVEICLPATAIQMAAECYFGLVEVGVGLIPGGGGNKELLARMMERMPDLPDVSALPFVRRAFETIAMATVSTSAKDAAARGFLRPQDAITVNRDRLLYEAKARALQLATHFVPVQPQTLLVTGETGAGLLAIGVYDMKQSGYISEHDERIARRLIHVLTGGDARPGARVSEQYMLDLEREAFLSLIGEPKTQARMEHMLKTGKPLRN